MFFASSVVFAGPAPEPGAQRDGTSSDTKPEPREPGTGIGIEELFGEPLPPTLPKLGLVGEKEPVAAVESFIVRFIINPIFLLSGGVAVIMIMYSAGRIIIARGEEEGLTTAKNTLIWAFLGLGLIVLSYTIVRNLAVIIARLF